MFMDAFDVGLAIVLFHVCAVTREMFFDWWRKREAARFLYECEKMNKELDQKWVRPKPERVK